MDSNDQVVKPKKPLRLHPFAKQLLLETRLTQTIDQQEKSSKFLKFLVGF